MLQRASDIAANPAAILSLLDRLAAVEAGLYCCSPTGRSTLVAHLEQRGYEVSTDALARAVTSLGDKVSVYEVEVGGVRVPLWVLRGTRCG